MQTSQQNNKPSFKCLSKLGSGAYATVWLAVDQFTMEHVAVKVVSDARYFEAAVYENNVSKDLNHPNLVQTRACFKTQAQTVMIVQEYAEQGDLFNLISPEVGMDELVIRNVFPQMVEGVAYLHSRNLVHRDIKPENVVIDGKDVAKLCDFGMMGVHGKRPQHGTGTTPYMSPEIHVSKGCLIAHKAHDIWALGVSLYVLLTGDFPWLKAVSTDREYAAFSSGRLTGSWKKFSPSLIALFRRMFAPIETRCTIEEVRASLEDIELFAKQSTIGCIQADEGASLSPVVSNADVRKDNGLWMSGGVSNQSLELCVKMAPREHHVLPLSLSDAIGKDCDDVQVAECVLVSLPTMRAVASVKC